MLAHSRTMYNCIRRCKQGDNISQCCFDRCAPPRAGDSAADSDTEQVPDDMSNETPFETADEFEVEEEVGEANDDTDRNRPTTAEASAPTAEPVPKKRKKNENEKQWKKNSQFDKQIDFVEKNHLSHSHPLLGGKSPVDIWQLMFDDKIISSLVEQTNLYAQRDKNCPDFCIIVADMLKFFGIILLSGYNTPPEEAH